MKSNLVLGFIGVLSLILGIGVFKSLQGDFLTRSGDEYKWHDFTDKVIVVNYFAEWCAPCIRELPELNAFNQYAQQSNQARLFGVSFDAYDEAGLTDLVNQHNIEFELITQFMNETPFNRPKTLPATFIFSKQGKFLKALQGEQTNLGLQEIVASL